MVQHAFLERSRLYGIFLCQMTFASPFPTWIEHFTFFCLVILKDLVLHTTSYSMIQGEEMHEEKPLIHDQAKQRSQYSTLWDTGDYITSHRLDAISAKDSFCFLWVRNIPIQDSILLFKP